MNTTPRLNWKGYDGPLDNPGCGRTAIENTERTFWQSRAGMRDAPQLVDIPALARSVRVTDVPHEAVQSRSAESTGYEEVQR